MSRPRNQDRVTISVLDRLVNNDSNPSDDPAADKRVSHELAIARSRSLRKLKEAVRRDLEWLLNTRRPVEAVPPDLKELNSSLAVYGLPDFTTISVKSPSEQGRMRRAIEDAIAIFEPRLLDVDVKLEDPHEGERSVRFRIEGKLKVSPDPEPVSFDTKVQLDNGEYTVRGE